MASKGKRWELALEAQHRNYRRDRRAVVWKTEPKRARDGKHVQKAPPDYVGCLYSEGRAVVAEAKATDGARFPLSMIKAHQARALDAGYQAGALALVLLRWKGVGYVLDWAWLRNWYQRWRTGSGPASLSGEEIKRCPEMGGEFGADWLGVLG